MSGAEQDRGADSNPGKRKSGPEAPADSFAFPRTARLRKHAAFERAYREGRRIFSGNLTVFFRRRAAGEPLGGPRIGFTVSRALGGAVERNRIKRRMRAAVRHHLELLSTPVDIVINPKKAVLKVEFTQLLNEIERAFAQIQQRRDSKSIDKGGVATRGDG